MSKGAVILSVSPNVVGGTIGQMVENDKDKNIIIYQVDGNASFYATNGTDGYALVNHNHGNSPTLYGNISITSQSDRYSVSIANFLSTAAQVSHIHGSISTAPIAGFNLTYSSKSDGLSLSIPAWITTAASIVHTHNYAGTGLSITGGNATLNSNGLAISFVGGTGEADGYNIMAVAGATANSKATVLLANSNNLTFGMQGGSVITASFSESTHPHPYMNTSATTAFMYSSIATNFAGVSTAATNVGLTVNSLGIRVSLDTAGLSAFGDGVNIMAAGTQTAGSNATIRFANSNNISFGMSNSTQITASFSQSTHTHDFIPLNDSTAYNTSVLSASFATTGHTHSNYIPSSASTAYQTGTLSTALMPLTYSSAFNSTNLSASFAVTNHTHTQYVGLLTTELTGASATINSSQFKLNIPWGSLYYSDGNGVTWGSSTNGVSTSISASVQAANNIVVGGNTFGTTASLTNGALILAGGNNITLSQVGNNITISGPNAGGAQTGISFIGNTASAITSGSVYFGNTNGISFGLTSNSITASHNIVVSNYARTGFTSSSTIGSYILANHNSDGLQLNVPNFLITAMVSNAGTNFVGLNTSGTNVAFTLNSSGFSFNGGSYARTGLTTQTTSGLYVVGTNNTFGLNLAVPAFLTTALAPNASTNFVKTGVTIGTTNGVVIVATNDTRGLNINVPAFITTTQIGSLYFSNGNGVTWGQSINSNSTTMIATAAGGGGIQVKIAGNTSGATAMVSSGTLNLVGGNNITLSQNNNSITIIGHSFQGIQGINAGTAGLGNGWLSMSNANNISFGLNGATLTASADGGQIYFMSNTKASFSSSVNGNNTSIWII